MLTLHLQLGAVRALLAHKGTISEPDLAAVLKELEGSSAVDEMLNRDAPSVDEAFDDLLRRLERTA